MIFWVPVVLWAYGPVNFLWLCNISLFLFLYAVWRGHALIASSQAGLVCVIGPAWTADFVLGLLSGGELAVATRYMFDPGLPWLARAASLYHVWLPIFAIRLLCRLGYDRRGPWLQSGIGALAVVGAWLLGESYRNINWVWAPFGVEQTLLPQAGYMLILLVAYPLLLYWPGHFLVIAALRLCGRRNGK